MFRIRAKFRMWRGRPYSSERCSGTQYRCRACNEIFSSMKELSRHLEADSRVNMVARAHKDAPKVAETVFVRALYTRDPHDQMRQEFLKLPQDHEYDPEP